MTDYDTVVPKTGLDGVNVQTCRETRCFPTFLSPTNPTYQFNSAADKPTLRLHS